MDAPASPQRGATSVRRRRRSAATPRDVRATSRRRYRRRSQDRTLKQAARTHTQRNCTRRPLQKKKRSTIEQRKEKEKSKTLFTKRHTRPSTAERAFRKPVAAWRRPCANATGLFPSFFIKPYYYIRPFGRALKRLRTSRIMRKDAESPLLLDVIKETVGPLPAGVGEEQKEKRKNWVKGTPAPVATDRRRECW